jgi:hypothetical protein
VFTGFVDWFSNPVLEWFRRTGVVIFVIRCSRLLEKLTRMEKDSLNKEKIIPEDKGKIKMEKRTNEIGYGHENESARFH